MTNLIKFHYWENHVLTDILLISVNLDMQNTGVPLIDFVAADSNIRSLQVCIYQPCIIVLVILKDGVRTTKYCSLAVQPLSTRKDFIILSTKL